MASDCTIHQVSFCAAWPRQSSFHKHISGDGSTWERLWKAEFGVLGMMDAGVALEAVAGGLCGVKAFLLARVLVAFSSLSVSIPTLQANHGSQLMWAVLRVRACMLRSAHH